MGYVEWLSAMRLKFLTATLIPVLLGTSMAWYDTGSLDISYFLATLLGISFIQIAANLSNDYFDYLSGNDAYNVSGSKFSGGSRVIVSGALTPKKVISAAYLFYSVGTLFGVYLAIQTGYMLILPLWIFGLLMAYFYSANPLRLSYRGFAEAANFLAFGPLITVFSYYVHTSAISTAAFLSSLMPGVLLAMVLVINEVPDYSADSKAGKKTLIVRKGMQGGIRIFHTGILFPYLYLLLLVFMAVLPPTTLLVLLTLPIAYRVYRASKENYENVQKLMPANAGMILLHLSFGLLLVLGVIAGEIIP
jgi:1,4-dihydroxy-2-naphthoate octaprenyltransferase